METNSQNLINNLNAKTQHVIGEFIFQDEETTKNEKLENKTNAKTSNDLFKDLDFVEEKPESLEKINLENNLEESTKNFKKKIYKKKFFKKYKPRVNKEIDNSLLIKQLQEEILSNLEFKINDVKKKLERENFRSLEQTEKINFYFVYLNTRRKNKIYNKSYGITVYNLNTQLYSLNYKTNFYKEFIKDCVAKIKDLLELLKNFKIKLFGPGSAYDEKVNIENLIKEVEEKIVKLKNNLNTLEKDLQNLIYNINLIVNL